MQHFEDITRPGSLESADIHNPGRKQLVNFNFERLKVTSQSGLQQLHGINRANSTGAGIPKQVTAVQVSVANAQVGLTSTVTCTFHRDPADKNLSGVYIWVKGYQSNPAPVQLASSADSPVTFVMTNTGETVSLIVQAYGNGGSAPLDFAPTSGLTLPKSTGGGVSTSSATGTTVSGTTGALAKIAGPSSVASTNLTGDVVTSNTPACTVVGIQGTSVDSLALLDGDHLRYSVTSGKYEPVMDSDWLVLPHISGSVPDVIYQNYWGSLTFTGGGSASLVASTASEVFGIKYATSTTAGTTAGFGLNGTNNALAFGNYRRLRFKLSLDQTATCRLWFGWGSTTGATFGIWGKDTLTTPFVGFRYSTNAGDTKYQCVTNTGSNNRSREHRQSRRYEHPHFRYCLRRNAGEVLHRQDASRHDQHKPSRHYHRRRSLDGH